MKNTMKLKLLAAAVMMVAGTAHAGTGYVGIPPAALVQQLGTDGSAATPYDFGVIGASATVLAVTLGGTPFGSFEEFANFTIPTLSTAVGSANTYTLNFLGINLLEITGLSVEVWDSTHPLGSTLFTTFPGNNATWAIGALAAGQYHLDISGTFGPNAGGGQYSVALQATPVPEPETYAMFLAGLGLMGFMARRRSKTS